MRKPSNSRGSLNAEVRTPHSEPKSTLFFMQTRDWPLSNSSIRRCATGFQISLKGDSDLRPDPTRRGSAELRHSQVHWRRRSRLNAWYDQAISRHKHLTQLTHKILIKDIRGLHCQPGHRATRAAQRQWKRSS